MRLSYYQSDGRECSTGLKLSPCHPVMEMEAAELDERRNNEVLHVKVTDDRGRIAHVHFTLSRADNGQVRGEVTVKTSQGESAKRVTAGWVEPNNESWRPEDNL